MRPRFYLSHMTQRVMQAVVVTLRLLSVCLYSPSWLLVFHILITSETEPRNCGNDVCEVAYKTNHHFVLVPQVCGNRGHHFFLPPSMLFVALSH